jgi:hypothetical protein
MNAPEPASGPIKDLATFQIESFMRTCGSLQFVLDVDQIVIADDPEPVKFARVVRALENAIRSQQGDIK